jgi:hypothetical protein
MKYNVDMKLNCTYGSGYGQIQCNNLIASGDTLSKLLDSATIFLIGNDGDDLGEIRPGILDKEHYKAIRTEFFDGGYR